MEYIFSWNDSIEDQLCKIAIKSYSTKILYWKCANCNKLLDFYKVTEFVDQVESYLGFEIETGGFWVKGYNCIYCDSIIEFDPPRPFDSFP